MGAQALGNLVWEEETHFLTTYEGIMRAWHEHLMYM